MHLYLFEVYLKTLSLVENGRLIVNNGSEKLGKELFVTNLTLQSCICFEEQKFVQNHVRPFGLDLNPGSPKYEAVVIIT